MSNRGTCAVCGRQMQVRADGLVRTHRDLADNRCLGGGKAPQPDDDEPVGQIPSRADLRASILNRVDVFTTRVDWIGGSAEVAFADSVIAFAEWFADMSSAGRDAA